MKGVPTVDFLLLLRSLDVTLSADGDRLRCNAPSGVITPDLQNELELRKPEILSFLAQASQAARHRNTAIPHIPRDGELPVSFAQMRLWLLDQLEPGSAAYNIPARFRLIGEFHSAVFERSLDEIVRRHEALRTYFVPLDGRPIQKIAPAEPFKLSIIDLQSLPEIERRKQAEHLAFTDAQQPFDLCQPPLLRATLLKLAPEDHILLLNIHHICFDGWSFGVFVREVGALYAAFLEGQPSPLPGLPVQYVDFAAWQRASLQGEILESQLKYWKENLSGELPVLEMPTDRPRPAFQTHRGSVHFFSLSPALTSALKTLSREEGVTLFVTLLAAFKVLLLRYTEQEDLLVGTAIAGRNRTEIEGLIGFFVNTLVMRTDLSGNPPFRELLQRVRKTAFGAYAHQDLPFERLVEEVNPERQLSRTPIFQVMFSLLNTPLPPLELPGLQPRRLEFHSAEAKFDLSVSLEETGQALTGYISYDSDLWDNATVERLARHLETLLTGIVADREQRLHALPLLTTGEREQLLVEWNDTDRDYPSNACTHELFERQVQRTPDAVAVECEQGLLTYAELNARANRLAHDLQELGVRAGEKVVTLLDRSRELVIAELAILKCGGAYVPLDPTFPAERKTLILADTQARIALCTEGVELPATPGVKRINLDGRRMPVDLAAGNLHEALNAESIACVMYTSGSTGQPKGVMVPHRAINRLVINGGYATFAADDRVAFASNPAFDASTMEVWAPLLNGGRIVVIARDVLLDPARFGSALERHAITILWLSVGLFNQYAEALRERLANLRYLIIGGDALDPQIVSRLLRDSPPQHFINGYGPTETTTFATTHEITSIPEGARSIPIGCPIANTRVYILDAYGNPVPIGVAGEIHIGGAGVAQGYLNRAELTAERFLPDPFAANAGSRMYKTGDIGKWLADGTIEFMGRNDFQVKIRGFRIELGEIEARLTEHAGVGGAVVVVAAEGPGDKRLVAYYTTKREAPRSRGGINGKEDSLGAEALRRHLAKSLPEYMLPAVYVELPELPLTANGKVDRKALPVPEAEAYNDRVYAVPLGETETRLADLWREVLRVDRVGRHDNFFQLGGHSLRATQVISRIPGIFNVEAPLRALFQSPTVAGLAAELEALRADAGQAVLPRLVIQPVSREGELPLSFAQMRLWLLDRMEPGAATYTIPARFRLRGKLDSAALECSFTELVRRHEALRTSFATVEGRPVQRIAAPAEFPITVVDLETLPEARREEEVARRATADAQQPFDLSEGPLLRVTLLRVAAEDHVLLLDLHHIVFDGWSFEVLARELRALYAAYREGKASPLPDLPIQYADFAVWQREWLHGEVLAGQLNYWKEKLSGTPPVLELPTDRARAVAQTYAGARVEFAISPVLRRALRQLSQREGATLFVTLLAAFTVLLRRHTGQEDLVLGTPIANRNRMETEGLIGFFVNTLVMRNDLSGNPTFVELLGRVQETAMGAYSHQDLPFEKLVEELKPPRDLSRSPIFQVMFSLANAPMLELELTDLQVEHLRSDTTTSKFDLSLYTAEVGEGLSCTFEYNTDLFDADRVERMARHFLTLLDGIAVHSERRLSELPLLGAGEREQLLSEWNQTAVQYPHNSCLHELFEAQAQRTPSAVAVEFAGARLSYGELNERASRLAGYLRGMGVGPETLVGVAMQRSLDLVVGLLAVLKAGGAYIPLDPAYPRERLAFVLEETQARIVLTQQSLVGSLPGFGGRAVCVDDAGVQAEIAAVEVQAHAKTDGARDVEPLAYVLYTSGSTGKPKGVEIRHRSVVNFLRAMREVPGMQAADTLLSVTTVAFDIFGLEVWLPLTTGAKVVMAGEEVTRDGRELAGLLRASGATVMQATPSTWRLLLESGWEGKSDLKILCGGEAWPTYLAEQLLPKCASLWNMYGPTETTIWSAVQRVEKGQPVVIGRPIGNTQFYVVDQHRQPAPVGVAGELLIGGEGVARGYWKRAELTAEKFMPDPFSGRAGSRLYQTGDRVRYRQDGRLEFLGRMDEQVKLRGFRIELGEIESVLRSHPGVREAVVAVREEREKQLVAYVVPVDEAAGTNGEWREYLKTKLPEYMIPTAWVRLPSLPLTPNGKIDRKALPAPEAVGHSPRSYEAPESETEVYLAGVWEEVLNVKRVGRNDNFFELGGHSLLAVQLIGKINKSRGASLKLPALFLNPTLKGVARLLERENSSVSSTKLTCLQPGRSEGTIFFLDASLGMCRLAELLPQGPATFAITSLYSPEVIKAASDKETAVTLRLEDIAGPVVELIERRQLAGPCVLVGFCFGGVLAFEVAHQLQRKGLRVDMVVLLDAWRTAATLWHRLRIMTRARLVWAVNWRLRSLQQAITRFAGRMLGRDSQAELENESVGEDVPWVIRQRIIQSVTANYQWRALEARGVLVRARDYHFARLDAADETRGWGDLFPGGFETIEIPGEHLSLLDETNLVELSQKLGKCLSKLSVAELARSLHD